MAGTYVNPFTDIGFKIIFGQPASKELLITLLNELLVGEHIIEDLSLLDKEDHAENSSDKGIIFDIYCRTSTGEYIIVEMQNRRHEYFLDRTLYYVCRAISRQVGKSSKDVPFPKHYDLTDASVARDSGTIPYGHQYKLHTVYGIFLMNFKEKSLPQKFRVDTVVADRDTGNQIHSHFRQIYLQFPYFKKELNECISLYDKLIYTLKHMDSWNRMPSALQEQVFERLERLAAVANLSEADRIAYDKALDSYWVGQAAEAYTLRVGIEEGMKKGMEKGREETNREHARKMKEENLPLDLIARITGLTEAEIEEL